MPLTATTLFWLGLAAGVVLAVAVVTVLRAARARARSPRVEAILAVSRRYALGDLSRPAHSLLLAAEVPIVEHLRGLAQLPGTDFRFFAVPPKIRAFGTFPVRAFASVPAEKS